MFRRAALFGTIVFSAALSAQEVHFKTRTLRPLQNVASQLAPLPAHRIVQFDHSPELEDLESLLKDGFTIVASLADNAVVTSLPPGTPEPTGPRSGVVWSGPLEPDDKISPLLAAAPAEVVSAVVEFHSDVARDRQDSLSRALGIPLRRSGILLENHALVVALPRDLQSLAQLDEVAYIFPADEALMDSSSNTGLMPCAGMVGAAGTLPQYANIVHGWSLESDNSLHLGYSFGSITPKVALATVQSEVLRAFAEWAKYSNIIFQPAVGTSSPRTIAVRFVSGSHGDPYPFDGPGGILAHTYYPVPINAEPIAGDMHLDADENWHVGLDVDIYSVVLHEVGHALGLAHSDKAGDVMYPYYRSFMNLSPNDIGAVQSLYGPPTAVAPITTSPTTPASVPSTSPATPVLRIAFDTQTAITSIAQTSVTGSIQGGKASYSVQWQTDHGFSGTAVVKLTGSASASWATGVIPLVSGANNISVTTFDSGGQAATQTAVIVFSAPTSPSVSSTVSVLITSPSVSVVTVNASSATMSGKASASNGIAKVTWQTAAGATGTASGTGTWVASGIPLLHGTNAVIIRAWDPKGNSAWSSVMVVRP